MQAMQLARICLRVLAILFFFQGLSGLPEASLVWRDYSLDLFLSAWVLGLAIIKLLPLLVGILFWWKTDMICRYLVKWNLPASAVVKISLRQMFSVALFTVGLLITLQAVPDLATYAVQLLQRPPKLQNTEEMRQATNWYVQTRDLLLTRLVLAVMESACGFALLIAAPHFARWIMRWWPLETTRERLVASTRSSVDRDMGDDN